MITNRDIEQLRKALNMPEQDKDYEKNHFKAEQVLDKLTELVSSSNEIHHVSFSECFRIFSEHLKNMDSKQITEMFKKCSER